MGSTVVLDAGELSYIVRVLGRCKPLIDAPTRAPVERLAFAVGTEETARVRAAAPSDAGATMIAGR